MIPDISISLAAALTMTFSPVQQDLNICSYDPPGELVLYSRVLLAESCPRPTFKLITVKDYEAKRLKATRGNTELYMDHAEKTVSELNRKR